VYVNRNTFFSATREFLKTSWTHETHYWGLNSLILQHWTSISGKLGVLWVQRFKHFYSLFQNTDSILNVISIFVFVANRLELRSVDRTQAQTHAHKHTHTRTNTHTHIHTHTRTKTHTHTNTVGSTCRRGRYLHKTQQTQEANIHALKEIRTCGRTIGRRPHGHRDRRLFIYSILNSFLLQTLNSYFVMYSFKLSVNIFRRKFLSTLL
jgi:ABC-type nickel/cobalt efflux system permease component RcnA